MMFLGAPLFISYCLPIVTNPQNFPSGFAGHLVDSMEILLHRRYPYYVRPEVEGITQDGSRGDARTMVYTLIQGPY
jgi:hypothetical protein